MKRPVPCSFIKTFFLLTLLVFVSIHSPCLAGQLAELRPYQREVTLTGFTYPRKEMTLTSEVSGRVIHITAEVGEQVPEDGTLAEIDTTFILLDIEANAIAYEQTARQLAQEEKQLLRYTTLLSQKSTPQAQLDEVTLARDVYRLNLNKLKNEAERLNEQLARHSLSAPPEWKVIERMAEPGEFIQAGLPIARLGDFSRLIVPFALTFKELQSIAQQPQLELYLPDVDMSVPAALYRQSPVFDEATRKIRVELIFDSAQPQIEPPIRGGMRAELRFTSREQNAGFRIAQSALINRYEASWLVKPDGERVQVILLGTGENEVIISGKSLAAGQKYQMNPELDR